MGTTTNFNPEVFQTEDAYRIEVTPVTHYQVTVTNAKGLVVDLQTGYTNSESAFAHGLGVAKGTRPEIVEAG